MIIYLRFSALSIFPSGRLYFNAIQFVIGVDHVLKPMSGVKAREIHEASKRFLESTRLLYPFLRLVKISFCTVNACSKKIACTAQGTAGLAASHMLLPLA